MKKYFLSLGSTDKYFFYCNVHTSATNGSSLLSVSSSDTPSLRVRRFRSKYAHFVTKLYLLVFPLIILCFLLVLSGCNNTTQINSLEEKKTTVAATFVPLTAHVMAVVDGANGVSNSTVSNAAQADGSNVFVASSDQGSLDMSGDSNVRNSAVGLRSSSGKYQVISIIPPSVDPHEYEPRPQDVKNLEKAEVIFINDSLFESNVVNLVSDKSKIVDTGRNIEKYPIVSEKNISNENQSNDNTFGVFDEKSILNYGEDLKQSSNIESRKENLRYDPHFWLDPINAISQVKIIRDTMTRIDPQNASIYEKNAEAYIQKLRKMNELYLSTFSNIVQKKLVLSHNFYQYPAKRYGLTILSTIENLSGVEPTSGQLTDALTQMKKQGITTVFVENNTENRIIQVISKDFGFRIYSLKSMETAQNTITANTYLDILEENRLSLVQGLSPIP